MAADRVGPIAGTVAHQLGTYAAVLSAHAADLEERAGRGPLGDAARAIANSAAGVRRVTDDLLELARIDAFELELEPLDPAEVLAAALRRLQADPAAAGSVVLEVGPLPHVLADRQVLLRVFSHLLRSAAAAREGGAPARVVAGGELRAGRAEIVLADDGPALEPARLVSLFDPGVPPRGRGPLLGAGVGLMVVAALVARLGGSVAARAASGARAPGVAIHLGLPGGGA